MKSLPPIFLVLALAPLPATPARRDFRVELFSNQFVSALSLSATRQTVSLCEEERRGPCLTLPAGAKARCVADGAVRCRALGTDHSFRILTVASAAPFLVSPVFASGNPSSPAVWMRNARVAVRHSGLQVVTGVDLDSYVSGVLRGEAAVLRSPAARQAMAILARTWAERRRGRHAGQGFDFCSLTHCQVFRLPPAGEERPVDPAARATQGQVLVYHGALADPYFTACCGGMTEAAANVWPDRAQPYLASVHDVYCLASPHASWRQSLDTDSLRRVLREDLHLPVAAPPTGLSVVARDPSGRALVLRVVAGGTWNIDANQFRYAVDRRLGWQQIKSNLYTVRCQGNSWVFSGHGLGHGVGLCQAGAEQMARLGSSAAQILDTYFPGTEIAPQPSANNDPIAFSEHFELVYETSQEPWVGQALDTLEQWRIELGSHAQVLPPRVRVRSWATVSEFVHATGEPGWMAASSDGQSIALQPLALLARRRLLNQTLRHELTHLVVHRLRGASIPRWFEEGFVLYLTGERVEVSPAAPKPPSELEAAIAHPRSEANMKAAYAQALERIKQLARRKGEAGMWRVLEHPTAEDIRWFAAQ